MDNLLIVVAMMAIGVALMLIITLRNPVVKARMKYFEDEFKNCKKIKNTRYIIYEKNNSLILFGREELKDKKELSPINIDKINDIRIYEDDIEKSAAGKALAGGIMFGTVGAIVGSSMKNQEVKRMGIKIYCDIGVFDFPVVSFKIKKGSASYEKAEKDIDEMYNLFIKYTKNK